MKALVWTEPGKAELQERPDPAPGPGEVAVRIRASGVCGSDLLGYLGKSKRRIPPLVLGHEMAGEISGGESDLALGTPVTVLPLFTCGACRSCRRGRSNLCADRKLLGMNLQGGFAEAVVVPRSAVFPVPASVSALAASMVEPLATPLNLFDSHVRGPVESVAVIGAGTQGLLALQLAKLAKAATIISVDPNDARRATATRLGATHVVDPKAGDPVAAVLDLTKGEGCDVVVDAAGFTATRQQGAKMTARGGLLGLVGLHDPETPIDCLDVIGREIAIHGVYGYTAAHFRKALEAVARGLVDVASWVREFPLAEGPAVLERMSSAPGDVVKASFTP